MNVRLMVPILASLLIVAGCRSLRGGGAPEPSFDIKEDLKQLAVHYAPATSVKAFYDANTVGARNEFITGRLVAINLRYMQFVRESTSERQLFDSATDIFIMSLGIAGASFADVTAKTVLAAVSAATSGTKATIDKNYYMDKTTVALIATMNARRAEALVPILKGTRKSLREYTFAQAVTDLHDYYFAGTYFGAIQAIQAESGARETEAKVEIKALSELPVEAINLKTSMTLAIGALKEAGLAKAQDALRELDPTSAIPGDLQGVQRKLQSHVREAGDAKTIEAVAKVFRSHGLIP